MIFPNPNFDSQSLDIKVKKIIGSHGQPLEGLDEETRALRGAKEGFIEIKPHEIPWMQHMIIARMKSLEKEIGDIENSINTYTAGNLVNAQERLGELKKEDNYLRNNFAEKFFRNSMNIDSE